jgi:colicin import membrane protein
MEEEGGTMDQRLIERLRAPGFTIGRRGYSQREVDNFLASMADWLESDAAEDLGQFAVKHKLELVGKTTAQILLKAEEEAGLLRRDTEEAAAQIRSDAEVAAREARGAADVYAKKTRERAEEEARRAVEAAHAKAKRIVEEGEKRRAGIEGVIADLAARRDETLEQLDRMQAELAATTAKHRGGGDRAGGGRRAKPSKDEVAPV